MRSRAGANALMILCGLAGVGCRNRSGNVSAPRRTLRVCADPNNLPFSNRSGEGFENKIAERLASSLGADLEYTWWAQRRGFVRNTLKAGLCDVVMGVPSSADASLTPCPTIDRPTCS